MLVSGKTVFDIIKQLNSSDIDRFIDLRLRMLQSNKEKELGLNTSSSVYDGFLDSNTKVNVTCEMIPNNNVIEVSTGSIRFNDPLMFEILIDESKQADNIYECVSKSVNKYLGLDSITRKHNNYKKTREIIYHQYSESMNKDLSIRLFHNNKSAMCAEVSGVVQNMFKFLDIDSDYVIVGDSNNDFHSFNLVYPNGRDKETILFDASRIRDGNSFIAILDEFEKESIFSNKTYISKEKVIDTYRFLFKKNIKWNKDEDYFILKDGYPKTIVDYKKPFTIERKLLFKNK